MQPLTGREYNSLSAILFAMCFSAPVFLISQLLSGTASDLLQSILPLVVSAGTFLSAVLCWRFFRIRSGGLLSCAGVGAMIGVLMHPVGMVLYLLFVAVLCVCDFLFDGVASGQWGTFTSKENLELVGFMVFWWGMLVVFFVGWFTAGAGAVIGVVLGVVYKLVGLGNDNQFAALELNSFGTCIGREDAPDCALPPSKLVHANLVALSIVAGLVFLGVWLIKS